MSVRAAGIPVISALSSRTILEVLPPSAALPLMTVAILSMWATHCTPEASPVHEFAPVPPKMAAPTVEPPEEAASTAELPKGVAPIHELTACPVMAMKAIHELTACSVLVKWSVHILALPVPPWLPAPLDQMWWSPALLFHSLPLLHGPGPPVLLPLFHGLGLPLLHGPGPPLLHSLDLPLLHSPGQPLPHGPGPPLHHGHGLAQCFMVQAMILNLFPCIPFPHVILLLVPLFNVSCSDWLF
ncbi:Arginine-glutamic acid dipeptide repeats protein [Labeo rohita]|uniref:Arginine-glutamic acid dipeptide repeats protein n=1 Tax=Labeo rohita TaxID=84645 RepID=A0ABQ8LVY0_LABRO|nr:Arginine-glutamic acid dipeptide repeats protein [Labeo rohita]